MDSGKSLNCGRTEQLCLLALCIGAIAGSFLLERTDSGRLALMGTVLPETCPVKVMLGLPCPGCGLTRSFAAMSAGEVMVAYGYNAMGPVIYVLCLLQLPYFVGCRTGLVPKEQLDRRIRPILWTVVIGFLVCWTIRIASEVSWSGFF